MTVKHVQSYFPIGVRWGGMIIFAFLAFMAEGMMSFIYVGSALIIVIAFFTTSYITKIDTNKKIIYDSFTCFGLTKSKKIPFKQIKSMVITKQWHSYDIGKEDDEPTSFWEYSGYLVYDNNQRFEIISSIDYQKLKASMLPIARKLKIKVYKEKRRARKHS